MKRTKLKSVFADPISSGIFSSFQTLAVPWASESIDSSLDLFFITNYGERNISNLTAACLDSDGELTPAKQLLLATALFNIYGKNWTKEYAVLSAQYDPIENYSMKETHTGDDTRTETPTNWTETETQTPTDWKQTETQTPTDWKETETKTPTDWKETETKTPTDWKETETQTPTDWVKTEQSEKADNDVSTSSSLRTFNSSAAVPVSESSVKTNAKTTTEQAGTYTTDKEQTGTFTTDKEQTGTFTTDKEQTGTYQTETEQSGSYQTTKERTGTYQDKTVYNTTLERSGNIGVTTSQQMIQSEIDLWKWNFFCDVVFPDVAKALTLSLY